MSLTNVRLLVKDLYEIQATKAVQVGIFYLIDNKLYDELTPLREAELQEHGDELFKNHANTHYQFWELFVESNPKYKQKDWKYYPRGRVIFSSSDRKFYVVLDKHLKPFIKEMVRLCNLPEGKYEVEINNEHYKCYLC